MMPSRDQDVPTLHVSVAGRTDTGRVRPRNEDTFVVADLTGQALVGEDALRRFDVGARGVLLAVSDGMGGAQAGDVASTLVVETLTRALQAAPEDAAPDELMEAAVQKSHRVVRDAANAPERSGMAATLTAVYVHGRCAYIAEVGDSRAYLVRAGTITQLTHDQSMVQLLLDKGVIEPNQVDSSPFRNVVLQVMGRGSALKVALAKLALRNRDCLVLCSDGLTGHVSDEEIRATILSSPSLDVACDKLVRMANERGGRDNITVVLAGISGDLEPSSTKEPVARTFQVIESYDSPPVHPPR